MKPHGKSTQVGADQAKRLAIEYCLFHDPILYTGGAPRLLPGGGCWQVPVLLDDPAAGVSAEVGELRIDSELGRISAAAESSDSRMSACPNSWDSIQGGASG